MALGALTCIDDPVGLNGDIWAIELLASATALNGVPATAGAGVNLLDLWAKIGVTAPDVAEVVLASTAGSVTMAVAANLWFGWGTMGGTFVNGLWVPGSTGTGLTNVASPAASKGRLNDGIAIDESGTDIIRHSEEVGIPATALRAYLEVSGFSGTATAVRAYLIARRRYGRS